MRWITNLKRIAKECKNGTYNFDNPLNEKRIYEFYEEHYLLNEEEFTFKQSDTIEQALKIFKKTIEEKYPDIKITSYIM